MLHVICVLGPQIGNIALGQPLLLQAFRLKRAGQFNTAMALCPAELRQKTSAPANGGGAALG